MLKNLSSIVCLLFFMAASKLMFAAPVPNPGGNTGAATPIDGGLAILLVIGAVYGTKKLIDNRKNNIVLNNNK